MANRIVTVGDDLTLPAPVKVADSNLPARLQDAALNATYVTQGSPGYDLVLLLGQSNMSGRGTPVDATRYDMSDYRIHQWGASGAYAGADSIAVEPLAMHDTPSGIGPGLAFARWYVQSIPNNRRVMLVPAAHGGTRISTTETPLGWRRGVAGNLYDQALTQASAALAGAGANARIVAAIWVQGESDGDNNVSGAQYQTDLDALINGLRIDLDIPDLPFIVGQMVPEYLSTGTRAAINAVHAATPSRIAHTAFSWGSIGQSLNDGNHYNAVAQRIHGRNMFDAYRRVLAGTADPALPSAPGQVTGVGVSAISAGLNITWSALAGAVGYIIEYRTTAGPGAWTRAGTVVGSLTSNITGLSPLTDYDVRVTAVNNGGISAAPSTVVSGTSGDLVNVSDNFNRADSTTTLGTATSGHSWNAVLGTWGISSNTAYNPSGSNAIATIDSGRANGTIAAKFVTVGAGSNHSRLIFRSADGTNFWMAQGRVTSGVAGKIQLYKSIAGTFTQVSTDSATNWVAGDVISVVTSGDSITVKQNGTTIIGPVTDAYLNTMTKHGLGAVAGGATPTFDDFTVSA